MTQFTGNEILSLFFEYFNEKVDTQWLQNRWKEISENIPDEAKIVDLIEPYENEVDDLVVKLAMTSNMTMKKSQEIFCAVANNVLRAFLMRLSLVTRYFEENQDKTFPFSNYEKQFILDYLTNIWKWIKENIYYERE